MWLKKGIVSKMALVGNKKERNKKPFAVFFEKIIRKAVFAALFFIIYYELL